MNLLPEEIVPTVLCYTICNFEEDAQVSHGSRRVDIAICNANSYILEFCNKRMINSCYIPMHDASKLQIFYNFTGESVVVYYLIRNDHGVMIIVKKWKETLTVARCYDKVKNLKIVDFENKGYPQLGVYYIDSDTVNIIDLSEFEGFKSGIDNNLAVNDKNTNNSNNVNLLNTEEADLKQILDETDQEMPSQNQNKSIVDFLTKRLHAMVQHNNELQYEVLKMNMLLRNSCKNKIHTSDSSSIDYHIKFGKSWCRIHLGYWILGVEFWSSPNVDFSKMKLVADGGDFTRYTHRFYKLTDVTKLDFSAESFGRGNHDPKMEFITDGSKKKEKKVVVFEVLRIKCIAVVEDVMACLVVRKEIALSMEIKYNLGITVENILSERLGFTKCEIVGENYFVKESGDLTGTCVSVKRIWIDLVRWNLRVSVTNLTTLRIFVGVLHNEFPMPVKIELKERH